RPRILSGAHGRDAREEAAFGAAAFEGGITFTRQGAFLKLNDPLLSTSLSICDLLYDLRVHFCHIFVVSFGRRPGFSK
ncbi:Protein of unknown function, partial [Gryllus bimaculatus]